jgi:hypothetical protein
MRGRAFVLAGKNNPQRKERLGTHRRTLIFGVAKMDGSQAFLNPIPAIHGGDGAKQRFTHPPNSQLHKARGSFMRVVVGSEGSRDFKQAQLDRHVEAMSRFIARVGDEARTSLCCTMVLRSATSASAQALILMKDALLDARVQARAILAKLEPEDALKEFFAALSALSADAPETALIRWARNPRLLEAHEQVTYGDDMCWSGDAMRRDASKRNPLVLFDTDAPEAARRGQLAFKALWAASVPVPLNTLVGRGPAKPSGTYEPADDTPLNALRPSFPGWPLIRH